MDNKNLELATSATSKIYEKVNRALSARDTDKRWFWELLQNAKDTVVSSKRKVDVKVELKYNNKNEPILIFSHNGEPFKHSNHRFKFDDPKCLLLADSGKIEEDETQREDITGQFGTGFLSTHILSLKILVEGIFYNRDEKYYSFSFELDRKYKSKFDLAEKVENSLNQYDNTFKEIEKPSENDFHTKFTYYLNENKENVDNGLEIAQIGIQSIDDYLPYVLSFSKEINCVEIHIQINKNETIFYKRENDLIKKINELQIIKIIKSIKNGQNLEPENKYIALLNDIENHIDISIELKKENGKYQVKPISKELPTLFSVFPLIGSEQWRSPVIINCTKFYPKPERDGILLLTNKDNGNQKLIEKSGELFEKLVNEACNHDWVDIFWLAKTHYEVCPCDWTSEDWYKNYFFKLREFLLTQKIVINHFGEPLVFKEAVFPFIAGKEKLNLFWDICYEFKPNKIPQKADIEEWNKIINPNYSTWKTDFKYSIDSLLTEIQEAKTISELAELHLKNNQDIVFSWLNKVIDFIFHIIEQPELIQKYAIIPNKNGSFFKIGDKDHLLHSDIDATIPNQVVEIYKILNKKDWSDFLLNPKIQIHDIPEIPKYGINHISQDIDNYISDNNSNQSNVYNAVCQIISFYSPAINENKSDFDWRNNLWSYTKDLNKSIPDFKELSGLNVKFWTKADNWILRYLVNQIQGSENIEGLSSLLNFEEKTHTIKWLNDFIGFYIANRKETYYSEKSIFPNQKGIFRKKQEVYIDNKIPSELKSILDRFTHSDENPLYWSYTNILLDKGITNITNHQTKSVKDISDKINELIKVIIKKDLTNPDNDKNGTFKSVFYDLVAFSSEELKTERTKLHYYAHSIFQDKITSDVRIFEDFTDFDFTNSDEWILKSIVEELNDIKNIGVLCHFNDFYKQKDKNQVLDWLDEFIYFLSTYEEQKHISLLNKYEIIANQNENFCILKDIKRDDNIPDDLKNIANSKHIRRDWNDWLLNKKLTKTNNELFDENKSYTIKDIADEIDGHIRDYKQYPYEPAFSELIFLLNQSETVKQDKDHKKYFPNFIAMKDRLIVGTLGEGKDLENVSTLLQDKEKLEVMAKIAKSDVTIKQLEDYSDAIELVGADNINFIVRKAKEEQEEINYHTKLGDLAEVIFKENFEQKGFEVARTGRGSDFKLKNENFEYLVEIKSFVQGFDNAVKMTNYQAKTAVKSSHYALCVFPKENKIPTKSEFEEKSIFVIDIKDKLQETVEEANQLEEQKRNAMNNQIGLVFEKWEYKYSISKSIWLSGINLNEFVEYIDKK